ncbi:MAG: pitrilysin family protein [Ignavibacteria bacterium]
MIIKKEKNNPVLLPVPEDQTISLKIWFRAGSQNDPQGKEGLAYITAQLLSRGASVYNSYEQILERLFPLATGCQAVTSAEMTVYSGRVHYDNLNYYYPLFIEGLIRPAFLVSDLNRIKEEMLNYLNTTLKYANDEQLCKAALQNYIFEGTSYGHITEGSISSVKSITVEDVVAFYTRYFNSSNYVIGLGGGYPKELLPQLIADLNALPEGRPFYPYDIRPNLFNGLNIKLIEKETDVTAISLGYPINLLRGSREWYALAVANSYFGEHRNSASHLYQIIRESRGLSYGAYSYIEYFPEGEQRQLPPVNIARTYQNFEVWVRPVPNDAAHFVLRTVVLELEKLAANGLTEENFELARQFLKKYILHFAQDTETRLGYAIDDQFYSIKGSHLEIFRNILDKLTLKEVNNAVKRHLQFKNMKVVMVTQGARELRQRLIADEPSPIRYASLKDVQIYNEDRHIENYPLNIEPEKVDVLNVNRLFE